MAQYFWVCPQAEYVKSLVGWAKCRVPLLVVYRAPGIGSESTGGKWDFYCDEEINCIRIIVKLFFMIYHSLLFVSGYDSYVLVLLEAAY